MKLGERYIGIYAHLCHKCIILKSHVYMHRL